MKQLQLLRIVCLLLLLFEVKDAKSNHIAGAELTYEYTGNPNEYLVSLKFYRDCNGISAPNSVYICLESIALGISTNYTAPLITSTLPQPDPCAPILNYCQGVPGEMEVYYYEVLITVPLPSNDWTLRSANCCISYVNNMQPNGLLAEAILNNLDAPTNSSPYFPIPTYGNFCVGKEFYWTHPIIDIDGDSLSFSLEGVYDGGWQSCPANTFPTLPIAPYTIAQPFSSAFPITIDSTTGTLHFKPTNQEICLIRILVREYRNGIEIGQTNRNVQIRIRPQCINYTASFTNSQLTAYNGSISATCSQQQLLVTFDTAFNCQSVVPTDFRSINSLGLPNPVTSVQPIGCDYETSDSLLLTFLNPFTEGDNFLWIKKGFDGNTILSQCGNEMTEMIDTIHIIVTDTTTLITLTDTIDCAFQQIQLELLDSLLCSSLSSDGSDFLLIDNSGNSIPISGFSLNCNISTDKTTDIEFTLSMPVMQSGPFYLILTSGNDGNTIANACGRYYTSGDTIARFIQNQLIHPDLGPDINYCNNQAAPVLNAGISLPGNYAWTLNGNLLPGQTQEQITGTTSGVYTVTVTLNGCSGTDTITVTHMPYPQFNLSDSSFCENEPYPLLIAQPYNNAVYEWYLNGNLLSTALGNQIQTAVTGTYQLTITLPNGCSETDSMQLNTLTAPQVNLPNTDICTNQTVILDAGNPGATYQWTTGATTQTIVVSTTGSYGVIVTANGCTQKDTALITVYDYPAEPVVSCQTGNGGYNYLYSWAPVPTAISYEVSIDGGLNWLPANTPAGPETHGLNTSIPGFIVRAIGPGICSTGWPSDPAECNIIVGNIFTPNGDLINDYFELSNIEQFPNNTVRIFNKWGTEIYTAKGYDNVKKRFEGNNSPDGVYLYLIDPGNGTDTIKGTVTISR